MKMLLPFSEYDDLSQQRSFALGSDRGRGRRHLRNQQLVQVI